MSTDRSFMRHAAVYGLATVLVQAGGFVLLPIYLRCLAPEDYGVLEIVGRLSETLGAVLLLCGLRQALFAFYKQAATEDERRRVVGGAFLLVFLAGLVGGVALLALIPWVGAWLAPAGAPVWLVALAVMAVLLEPFSLFPLTLIQARIESNIYVVVVVTQFLFRVGLCILLVRFLHWGVPGALAATAVTGTLFGLLLSLREFRLGVAWPGIALLRSMLAFSLPLLPAAMCYFILHHGDRFFLLRYSSAAEIGTYALGYKLAMVVRLVSLSPLFMVWSSRMYDVARTEEAPVVFGIACTRILAAYLYVGLGLCLFTPEIVGILGGDAYDDAISYVLPVTLACFLQAAATLMDAGFLIRRRTGLKFLVTLAATVIMLGLYAGLIPTWGARGAAIATLGGFASLALGSYLATQRIFPVCYEWGRLLGVFLVMSFAWLAANSLPAGTWGVLGRTFVLLLVPLVGWGSGLVRPEEKQHIRDLVALGLARIRRRPPSLVMPLDAR